MTTKQAGELYKRTGFAPPAAIATPDASKYNARAKMLDGHRFDSTGEAEAYRLLKSWEACGAITELTLQPEFILQAKYQGPHSKTIRAIKYRADFSFRGPEGELHVVDFKGYRTPVYKLKLKMFLALYREAKFEEWTRDTLRHRPEYRYSKSI